METMENQATAEQKERQQRTEAARKLLKLLEESPLDEAVQLTTYLLSYLLWRCKVEPWSGPWDTFFHALQTHIADQVNALDSVPSPPLVH